MEHITCKVCRYTYGAWRMHCPACSTLAFRFIGKKWSTRKDGVIHKPINRAHYAFEVEQNLQRKLRTGLADPDQ